MQVLMGADGIPATPMLPPIDEAALWELELREGSVIERTDRIPCTIALGQVSSLTLLSATLPCIRFLALPYASSRKDVHPMRRYYCCKIESGDGCCLHEEE